MSIIPLSKITWYGSSQDKDNTLERLQRLGCLHIIPLAREKEVRQVAGPTQEARDALQFLLNTRVRRRPSRDAKQFDAVRVEKDALALRDAMARLSDEKDQLAARIEALKPWGRFTFLPLEEMGDLRFWFYAVPHKEMKSAASRPGVWKVVKKDQQFFYVVVVAKDEPVDMPVARVHTGSRSLAELEERLQAVETELDDLEARKLEMTQWCDLYHRNLYLLENQALRAEVGEQTFDQHALFALQAWAPKKQLEALRGLAKGLRAALIETEPGPDEPVPTLLENPALVAGGADLVTFYMTPGYRMWDPSIVVFFSFAIFFAMILSDAGYSLLMTVFLALKWKSMSQNESGRRMRNLLTAILGASVIWGVMVGSYLGMAPPAGGFLARLKVLDINDAKTMMFISITIGIFHICLANILDAWRRRKSTEAFIPLGWLSIFVGGYILALGGSGALADVFRTTGTCAMSAGALMLVLFSSSNPNIFKRIFGGIGSLARLSSAFGDVLSYLRLFALGVAGASLAGTFNGLAKQIFEGMPGFGIILAALIFLFGHILNLVLSLVSCLVHGLRLNVIEFFNWSMYEEGKPFKPFVTKGGVSWNN